VYFIYSFLLGFAALLLLPYWLVHGLRHGKYFSNLGQRFGLSFPALAKLHAERPGAIWLHAVSVGETLSGVTLARRLKEAYPDGLSSFLRRRSQVRRSRASGCPLPMPSSIFHSTGPFAFAGP